MDGIVIGEIVWNCGCLNRQKFIGRKIPIVFHDGSHIQYVQMNSFGFDENSKVLFSVE